MKRYQEGKIAYLGEIILREVHPNGKHTPRVIYRWNGNGFRRLPEVKGFIEVQLRKRAKYELSA